MKKRPVSPASQPARPYVVRPWRVILGLVMVVLAAWPAKLTTVIYTSGVSRAPEPIPGSVTHHIVFVYGHPLRDWQIQAAVIALGLTAMTLFLGGLVLALPKSPGKPPRS